MLNAFSKYFCPECQASLMQLKNGHYNCRMCDKIWLKNDIEGTPRKIHMNAKQQSELIEMQNEVYSACIHRFEKYEKRGFNAHHRVQSLLGHIEQEWKWWIHQNHPDKKRAVGSGDIKIDDRETND